jgi:SAM-dependent MidA family methyltransferase
MPSWIADIVAGEGGRVSFDRFMELALYHPDHGYYTGNISEIGAAGDFSTGLTIGKTLARSIAAWVKAETKILRLPTINVIELGGGSGVLATQILQQFLPWHQVRYQIVEISPRLRALQQTRIRSKKAAWHTSIEVALAAVNWEAILVANEFVDAFPCKRYELTSSGWKEIFLRFNGASWKEELATFPPADYPGISQSDWHLGQRIERHPSYKKWFTDLAAHLRKGSVLTIDYGGTPTEIYRDRRPGTVRAYFRHERRENMEVYREAGRQDITADVNFADLQEWGRELNFETVSYMTQAKFIEAWAPSRSRRQEESAHDYLVDESGMGGICKVLHQRKREKPEMVS